VWVCGCSCIHMYVYICMHTYIHIHISRKQEPGLDISTWQDPARRWQGSETTVFEVSDKGVRIGADPPCFHHASARTRVVHYKRVERVDTAQILKSTLFSDFHMVNILGHRNFENVCRVRLPSRRPCPSSRTCKTILLTYRTKGIQRGRCKRRTVSMTSRRRRGRKSILPRVNRDHSKKSHVYSE
jgi:hypothetical protein